MCSGHSRYVTETSGLEEGAAYHLDIALTIAVDGDYAGTAGICDSQNQRSLSICVPLIYLWTSVS